MRVYDICQTQTLFIPYNTPTCISLAGINMPTGGPNDMMWEMWNVAFGMVRMKAPLMVRLTRCGNEAWLIGTMREGLVIGESTGIRLTVEFTATNNKRWSRKIIEEFLA